MPDTSLLFTLYRNRKLCTNGHCSFLSLSETFRSMKNFILAFLQCSEAWKSSFWPFWNVQKHEKSPFGLSETFRSMKNLHLVFLKCSEAWKTSFWPFCSVHKHEKLLFCLSAVCRSVKNLSFAFLQCAEAWKTSFWPFCSVQKHEKSLFLSFHAALKYQKSLFRLSAPRLSTKNLFFAFLRRA